MYCNRGYIGTEVHAQDAGCALDGLALMLCDNMSVVLNTTVPSSMLKKKHLGISYHRVIEAITAKILRFAHVRSEENLADILTKPLANPSFFALVKPIFFRASVHVREQDSVLKAQSPYRNKK